MCYEIIETTWVAVGLLFTLCMGIVAIVTGLTPPETDNIISYYEDIKPSVDRLLDISLSILIAGIITTWVFTAYKCYDIAGWWILTVGITVAGFIMFHYTKLLLYKAVTGRVVIEPPE